MNERHRQRYLQHLRDAIENASRPHSDEEIEAARLMLEQAKWTGRRFASAPVEQPQLELRTAA